MNTSQIYHGNQRNGTQLTLDIIIDNLINKMNMRTNTFYIKSMNPNSFTLSELILLRDALKLKTIDDIFNLNYKEEKK